jgi:hypothetical protein
LLDPQAGAGVLQRGRRHKARQRVLSEGHRQARTERSSPMDSDGKVKTLSPKPLEEPGPPLPIVITQDQYMVPRHRHRSLEPRYARCRLGRTSWADRKRHTQLEPANILAKS